MPRFSAFTPLGMLSFSNRPSHAETIFRALVSALGGNFDLSRGTHIDATAYARARALARARYTLERGGHQADPLKATDLIPALERDYGLAPAEKNTIHARRRAIATRQQILRGARRESVEDGLRQILGDDFIAYRTLTPAEVIAWPQDPSLGPGAFADARIPARVFVLRSSIPITGRAFRFAYAVPGNDDGARLVAGDLAVVQPENTGLAERVTIVEAFEAGETLEATATFTRAHDVGASLVVGAWPIWVSTQRFALVVVRRASDPELRRRVHELMDRIARGVSQWAIVAPRTPTTLGPFTCASPLGTAPLGVLSIP
jgi:hypothetical protein